MPYFSRNMVLACKLETTLAGGAGAVITIGAATAGVLPLAAPTVTNGGASYPASTTLNVRYVGNGGATAAGTVTTNASGVITAATVASGGGGYTNAGAAAFSIVGTDLAPGTYSTPSATGTDAVLIGSDMTGKININKVERDVLRGFLGAKETLPGSQWVEMSFTTELSPSGTLGLAPACATLLKCAGFSEVYTTSGATSVKIDYTPVSDNMPSCSLLFYFGGTRLAVRGARVSKMEMDASVADYPKCKWTIIGILQGHLQSALVVPALGAWKAPVVITDANTGDIRFNTANTGYSNTTGAITGGSTYPSKGMQLSVNNNAKFRPFLGGDTVPITQREVTAEMQLDLLDVDRIQFYTDITANTLKALSMQVGTVAGNVMKLFMPAVERQDPDNVDDDGILLASYSIRARPSAGNDELRFVFM